jgi:hypothetical protein
MIMKSRLTWLIVPLIIIFALSAICGYLLNQNAGYAKNNRQLLLQNDSVLSANLSLRDELEKMKHILLKAKSDQESDKLVRQ